jgi:hypothetical protein
MHQAIRQPLFMTHVILGGFAIALLSLFQPIPFASAQQLLGSVSQETDGTGTQGRRIENFGPALPHPTKSIEKKNAQTATRKPHRLIRKKQNTPVASVEPAPSGSSPLSSVPIPPPSLQSDNTTSQSKEPTSLSSSVGAVVPLATMSVAPSSATATGSIAVGTAPTGTIPLAAAGAGKSSTSGSGDAGGRTMSRLAAEMPGLRQLLSPASVPVVSVNPAIGASPTSLSFTAQKGGGNPTAQTLSISNAGGGTLSWSASDNTTWLSLSPASGTGTGAVTVSVTTGTLTAGSYSGAVTMSATGASSVTVPVTFTVATAPVSPAIGASPTSLSLAAKQGGANPATQTVSISNTGDGTLSWSASDNAPWLTLSPASGTGNGAVTLAVSTGTLTAGSYSGAVTMSATGASSVTVPVTFTVATASVSPAIGASPTSLSFAATQGSANPATQTVSISNTGGGTLSWSASSNTTWMAVSPASGTGNGAVTVSATTGILTAGSYNGNITLSATGATSRTVPVTFTVTAAPKISLNPSSLTYAAARGAANPANQTVSLTNTGGTLSWTVSDSASWLSVSPASGSSSSTLTTAVNTSGLAAGTYNGTITVSATGSSSKTVGVTLTVSAPTTSSATLTWTPNTDADLAGYKIYRATASGAYGAALATVPAGTVTYQATGLTANTTYFFVITAYDSAGNESLFSNEVNKIIL